ncbi:hypothetical protein AM10699_07020 [Acaryochloris marina MBIC10699]|nr:hypothetical protein AM10699_07020 [Acaryochloris marina MBIC10699]
MQAVEKIVSPSTRSIHVFDREGDIAEVFERLNHLNNTGVVVRASHNRRLEQDPNRLWKKLEAQSIQFEYEIDLPKTKDRSARIAKLVVRCCLVQLQRPTRLADSHPLQVYAVYATEVDPQRMKTQCHGCCSRVKQSPLWKWLRPFCAGTRTGGEWRNITKFSNRGLRWSGIVWLLRG